MIKVALWKKGNASKLSAHSSLRLAQFHVQRKYSGGVYSMSEWMREQAKAQQPQKWLDRWRYSVQHRLRISHSEV